VGIHEDHCVVCRAPPEGTGPRIQNAVHSYAVPIGSILGIPALALIVAVMANKEVPFDGVILGSEGVKTGNVVVAGKSVHVWLERVAAAEGARISSGLQQNHITTGFGKAGSDRTSSGAGTHDDVFTVRWWIAFPAHGRPMCRHTADI